METVRMFYEMLMNDRELDPNLAMNSIDNVDEMFILFDNLLQLNKEERISTVKQIVGMGGENFKSYFGSYCIDVINLLDYMINIAEVFKFSEEELQLRVWQLNEIKEMFDVAMNSPTIPKHEDYVKLFAKGEKSSIAPVFANLEKFAAVKQQPNEAENKKPSYEKNSVNAMKNSKVVCKKSRIKSDSNNFYQRLS